MQSSVSAHAHTTMRSHGEATCVPRVRVRGHVVAIAGAAGAVGVVRMFANRNM